MTEAPPQVCDGTEQRGDGSVGVWIEQHRDLAAKRGQSLCAHAAVFGQMAAHLIGRRRAVAHQPCPQTM